MQFNEAFFGMESGIADMESSVADYAMRRGYELLRPFHLLRPRVFQDGNMWCVLLGENLQEGVAAFGDTPDAATRKWDKVWMGEKTDGEGCEKV